MKKKKNKIYYLGFYGDEYAYSENRYLFSAGVNKMDYVSKAMGDAGFEVTVVSPAWLKYDKKTGIKFSPQRKFKISKNVKGILPFSIALPFRIAKPITTLISKIWLILYFLFTIRKNDNVVVYNSPFYFTPIYLLKKIIGFNLVLEVEEVYSVVFSMNKSWHRREKRLIEMSDSYIFPNDLMYNYLNIKNKKQIVVYGSYSLNKNNIGGIVFNDDKVHVVYAGIIDKLKNGAFNAVKAAEYLPYNYVIHILGFGQQIDIDDLNRKIETINNHSECKIIFEGKKIGEEYVNFITGCQIGLSTQNSEGDYLKFTFPSKVMSYLSMGLNVVAAKMDCLTKSKIAALIQYYNNDDGKSISDAIMSVKDFDKQKPISKIKTLNTEFIDNLRVLLTK